MSMKCSPLRQPSHDAARGRARRGPGRARSRGRPDEHVGSQTRTSAVSTMPKPAAGTCSNPNLPRCWPAPCSGLRPATGRSIRASARWSRLGLRCRRLERRAALPAADRAGACTRALAAPGAGPRPPAPPSSRAARRLTCRASPRASRSTRSPLRCRHWGSAISLVEVGGELRAAGRRPGGDPWQVLVDALPGHDAPGAARRPGDRDLG